MNNGTLPALWQIFAEYGVSPLEAIADNKETAAKRLKALPTHVLLHPQDLATLAALADPILELNVEQNGSGNNKRTTWGHWGDLTVLAIERHYRRGWSSQAQKWNVWFGRLAEEAPLNEGRKGANA